ncbi:hypothetical protein PIB30_003251 [Stylosanthes scabra]|uniref:Uncharacterized protein n=1 Tax=Stylosanthes scabra TaxID=79078 RepID=A0ABU6R3B9_9FABA|nr:hypothetical protein [Stylosanthes scabra]
MLSAAQPVGGPWTLIYYGARAFGCHGSNPPHSSAIYTCRRQMSIYTKLQIELYLIRNPLDANREFVIAPNTKIPNSLGHYHSPHVLSLPSPSALTIINSSFIFVFHHVLLVHHHPSTFITIVLCSPIVPSALPRRRFAHPAKPEFRRLAAAHRVVVLLLCSAVVLLKFGGLVEWVPCRRVALLYSLLGSSSSLFYKAI